MRKITAKVIRFSHERTFFRDGRSSTVYNYLMKDCNGMKIHFALWGPKNNAYANIGDILEFSNMKVDKFPPKPPHFLATTDSTVIRVLKDKTALSAFEKVQGCDGTLVDYYVEIVHDVGCYKSCAKCGKGVHEDNKICQKCKAVLTTVVDDFRFKMYLKKEDEYVELQGFKKSIGEWESVFHDLDVTERDDVEEKLSSVFEGKIFTVDYDLKDEDQKTIQKIHPALKTESKESEEEPKKKKARKMKPNNG